MNSEELLSIADEQDEWLARMSARHQARLQRSITRLERRIVDSVSLLSTTNAGALVGPRVNLTQAQKVHSDLTQLFDEEYGESVRTTLSEYDRSLPQIQAQYEAMSASAEFTGVDKEMMDTLKRRDFAEYQRFGQQAQDKVASAMYDSVVAQAPFSSLVSTITGIMVGHTDARGMPMSRYASQMANDGIMNFHNAVNMKKARDLGFKSFLYYGNIIKDSRDFCIRRAGKVYTEEEIKGWTFPWQGKSGPAMTHRGGYNCRHGWQPVRPGWLPEEGIEVESWFDRSTVGALPPGHGDMKFKMFQAWKRSVMVTKSETKPGALLKEFGDGAAKKNTVNAWVNQWRKGMNLPEGWQTVVKELEQELTGLTPPVIPPIVVPPPVVAPVVAPAVMLGPLDILPNLTPKQNAFRLWINSKGQMSVAEASKKLGPNVPQNTISAWRTQWSKGIGLPEDYGKLASMTGELPAVVAPVITPPIATAQGVVPVVTAVADAEAGSSALLAAKAEVSSYAAKINKELEKLFSFSHQPVLTLDQMPGGLASLHKYDIAGSASRAGVATFTEASKFVNPILYDLRGMHKVYMSKVAEYAALEPGFQAPVLVASKNATTAKAVYDAVQEHWDKFVTTFRSMGVAVDRAPWVEDVFRAAQNAGSAQKFYDLQLANYRALKTARYNWLEVADEATYRAEKRKSVSKMMVWGKDNARYGPRNKPDGPILVHAKDITKEFKQGYTDRAALGLDWVPIDLMEDMVDAGYKINYVDRKGRAFFRGSENIAQLYLDEKYDVIAHEFGHAIDAYWARSGSTGAQWSGRRFHQYVTEADASNFRNWFSAKSSGVQGTYSNGDGAYWKNNWLNTYEGRIYNGEGVGNEWWTMNIQRLSYERARKLGPSMPDEWAFKYQDIEHHSMKEGYNESWNKAKEAYPELTAFMNSKFKGRTIMYSQGEGVVV